MGGLRVYAARRVRRAALAGLLAGGLVLGAAGCGGADPEPDRGAGEGPSATASSGSPSGESPSGESPSSPPAGSSETASAGGPGVVIRTGGSAYGRMLFDGRQQAIYLFDREGGTRPRCYGECAEAWPPVLADGEPQARGAVRAGLLGTVERRDGSVQVTYGGHPLYYYAHEGPGQVLCHDIVEYGGTWLVVTPQGEAAPA
jgi:predicted lipoprotein with Yx(FWY)xxD motif